MLVLDTSNSYSFANMVIKVTDNTVAVDDTIIPTPDTPDFNMLIPTVQDIGITNTLELYYPGEPQRYLNAHGNPNAIKYGFGPDLIYEVLSRSNSNIGVYTINLRDADATMANVMVDMKYKVVKDVPYLDSTGAQYYLHTGGKIDTTATDGTAIQRDVLHIKFETSSITTCKKWTDLLTAMNEKYSGVADGDGYITVPWFGVMYRGATSFANNIYFKMTPTLADFDRCTYYKLTLYDGISNSTTTSATYNMDETSGEAYNTSYYFENRFNNDFPTLRAITSEVSDKIKEVVSKYTYTVDDYINGKMDTPTYKFTQIDIFNAQYNGSDLFGIVLDEGSLNIGTTNAFALSNGTDGTKTRDQLFESFFKGEILGDIASPIRYRFSYIPDLGYVENDTIKTKTAIINLVKKRNRTTVATLIVGGTETFESAITQHQTTYYSDMPCIRQLAAIQSPLVYNTFVKRTISAPPTYFDTIALADYVATYGDPYQPFAGADARWTGFIEDTMVYPANVVDYINSLQTSRINFVMKDARSGAYLADQQMNTTLTSDQTELNNAFLISSMLYDLINLVHLNHFKFNEAEEVRLFKEAVTDTINTKYKRYSASLTVEVYRIGTVGRSKSANKITVTINMKDINKFTDIDIILTDE